MKKLTHSGNILIAGFILMLGLMSFLIYKTMKADFQMVADDYYEQELTFQNKINAKANAAEYAGEFKAVSSDSKVEIIIPAALSKSLSDGLIYFYCPSDAKMDQQYSIEANEQGRYLFPSSELQGNAYTVKISFTNNNKDYFREIAIQ